MSRWALVCNYEEKKSVIILAFFSIHNWKTNIKTNSNLQFYKRGTCLDFHPLGRGNQKNHRKGIGRLCIDNDLWSQVRDKRSAPFGPPSEGILEKKGIWCIICSNHQIIHSRIHIYIELTWAWSREAKEWKWQELGKAVHTSVMPEPSGGPPPKFWQIS